MLASVVFALGLATAQSPEVLAHIQVHGNTVTPSAEIVQLAGLSEGMTLGPGAVADAEARLRRSNRFERVEVRRRLASITDATQVLLVIVVDEGPVRIEWDSDSGGPARAVRRRVPPFMFLPVLDAEDGYGFTYGARFAVPGVAGARSRLSMPLTWGGERRAGLEIEKSFSRGPFTRVQAGASLDRRVNPFFDEPEGRRRAWGRAERAFTPQLRAGINAGWNRVGFNDAVEQFGHFGVEAVVDTRLDPFLARNAVYGRASWERLGLDVPVSRTGLEAQGYIGVFGQSVLVTRVLREDGSGPLPLYLKSLAGGAANLRGFKAGAAAGDTLVAASVELRVPLTSPLSLGKLGVSGFVDAATVYDDGQRLGDQTFERGVGASVWFTAAIFRLNLAVARGIGGSTRVHFGTNLAF